MKYPQVQIIIDILSRIDNSAKSKLGFDMGNPFPDEYTDHKCGTACCIGGWAQRAMDLVYGEQYTTIQGALSQLTNIPDSDAYKLCFPRISYNSVSLKVALKTLRRYRDTGVIDYIGAGATT